MTDKLNNLTVCAVANQLNIVNVLQLDEQTDWQTIRWVDKQGKKEMSVITGQDGTYFFSFLLN